MTESPFESPQVNLFQTPEGRPVGDFTIGAALQEGWRVTWSTIGVWLPAGIIGMIVTMLAAITIIGYFVVVPVMAWGFVFLLLNMIDKKAEIGDVFAGFSRYGTALGRMLLAGVVFIGIGIGCNLPVYIGMAIDSPELIVAGQLIGTIVNLVITIRLYFAVFLIVDQDMAAIEALRTSWSMTRGRAIKVFLMVLLSIPIAFAGMLALVVGIIPACVIIYAMFTSAYRQMCPKAA